MTLKRPVIERDIAGARPASLRIERKFSKKNANGALLVLAMAFAPSAAMPQEEMLIKFICSSTGAVVDVVARADDLIMGLSPLPAGCAWMPWSTFGTVGETVFHVAAPLHRVARVSRVTANGRAGFSAGLIELLS